ncbi:MULTISPECIES: hypothetical protein [Arthrobacter]|uniref:hypothetical protein n=1 Tax=Arthrobacter TaxID=1663 RepID=UPI001475D8DC|nr:hypothetical protein [Arthrobacter psychrochitiniphilus]NYG18409.1 hypothetical protein [Arthrobacter psychrochitiniphilus]
MASPSYRIFAASVVEVARRQLLVVTGIVVTGIVVTGVVAAGLACPLWWVPPSYF